VGKTFCAMRNRSIDLGADAQEKSMESTKLRDRSSSSSGTPVDGPLGDRHNDCLRVAGAVAATLLRTALVTPKLPSPSS